MKYFDRSQLDDFNKGILGDDGKENWDNFLKYYGGAMSEAALSKREKELMAFAVALTLHCPYCIEAYTEALLDTGLSKEEINEAIQVTAAMNAGATLATAMMSKNLQDELEF